MLRTIAVDDEPMALEIIKKFSSKSPLIDLVAVFTRASKALEYLQNEKVDLVFLDIKMPDISGIKLLKSLTYPPVVIFTTAYSKHAVEGFELDAIDYLLKPFSMERFLKACEKAFKQIGLKKNFQTLLAGPPSIFVKSGYEQISVVLEDILYVEGSGNYVQFIMTNRKILSRLSLNDAENLLPVSSFIRIHRSYIIAIKHIRKIEKNRVWINNVTLSVSAGFADALQNILKK
jgi:DNA-binding LytR/AlgR family response regulator